MMSPWIEKEIERKVGLFFVFDFVSFFFFGETW